MKPCIIYPSAKATNFLKSPERLFRYLWAMLAGGLLLAELGIRIIWSPFQTYLASSWLVAVGMIGTGILYIGFAWLSRRTKPGCRNC